MTVAEMTSSQSNPSYPEWKTVFADFGELPKGRQYIEGLRERMTIGTYSISAPTGNGGCRVGVQVPKDHVQEAQEFITELRGTVGPAVSRRKESVKIEEPKAAKPKEEKEKKSRSKIPRGKGGICPYCKKEKRNLDNHLGETHLREQAKERKNSENTDTNSGGSEAGPDEGGGQVEAEGSEAEGQEDNDE